MRKQLNNRFEELEVWREAHKLTLFIYKETKKFPSEEKFRLVDQICRSASSVPTNIVEGNSKAYKREYLQFLFLAKGSLEETKYHLLLSMDLGYLEKEKYETLFNQCNKVGSLLGGLIKYLKSGLHLNHRP